MKNTDIAWAAGLFDGEGCVYSCMPRSKRVCIEVAMSHRETLERLNALFPGRINKKSLSPKSLSIKPQWTWRLDTNGVRVFFTATISYLVTKRRHAEVALRLCDRTGSEDLLALSLEMRALNA